MQTQLADAVLSGAAVAEQPADLTEQQAAAIILKALSCFAHFVSMGPRSMTTLTLYRALLRLLAHNGRSTVSDVR